MPREREAPYGLASLRGESTPLPFPATPLPYSAPPASSASPASPSLNNPRTCRLAVLVSIP
jgi:hypothetical protein